MTETAVEMDRDSIEQFLGTGGTGVISLSTSSEDPPHAVPVSYGYDRENGDLYFRLAVGADSEKGNLDGRPVAFVTYGTDDDRWQSVVARGRLRDVEGDDPAETLAGFQRVHIPLVDVFGRRPDAVTFEFYHLRPDELSGRTERSTRE